MLTSYSLIQVLFSQKMMTLFLLLFGASIINTEKMNQGAVIIGCRNLDNHTL